MGAGRIFVVDDDDDIRASVASVLEAEGYEVRTASNGRDALRALTDEAPPDLMLLDLMMPFMSGWDVLEAVARVPHLAALSIVVFSAADEFQSTPRLTRPLLRKPIDLDLLLEMVQRLCEARTLGDEPPSDLFPKML